MKKRRIFWALGALILGIAAATVFVWHQRESKFEWLSASLPPRPDLAGKPAELQRRIASCEERVRKSDDAVVALGDLSVLYHANGFYAEAIQCYQGLIELDPNNPLWPHRMAVLLAGYGRLDAAFPLLQRTVKLAPDYLPARIRLGDAYLKTDRNGDAAKVYLEILSRDPRNPYALLGMARMDVAAGRWEQARDRLESASAVTQESIGGNLLPTVYEHLGNTARAEELRGMQKAGGAFFDVPDPWVDGLMDDCFDIYRLSVAAGNADHGHNPEESLRLLKRALNLEPDNAPANLQIGLHYMASKDYAKARQHLEHCVRTAPEFSDGYAYFSDLLMTLGDRTQADRVLADGLSHCPTSPGLHQRYAQRLRADGRIDEAIAEYLQTERLRPDDADPFVELASVYFSIGRVKEGGEELKKALRSDPGHPLALSTLGFFYIQDGDQPNATELLKRVRLQPRISRPNREALEQAYRARFGAIPE